MTWPWPAHARGLLAGTALVAAVWLAAASGFERPSSGETFVTAPELVVDANTAPAWVLTALPHFGPALVREWIAARDDRPFSSLEDARARVRGLGPVTVAQIAPYFRFDPSIQSPAQLIASSSFDRPVGKPRSNRRKPSRSNSGSASPKPPSPRAGLAANTSELETRRGLSIARHD